MPTASGRETAQEKRDRQHRERWAAINAAVAALPPGWADAEAGVILADDAALRAAGAPSYEHARREYPTHPEAVAVARSLTATTGREHYVASVYDLRHGKETVYRVEHRS